MPTPMNARALYRALVTYDPAHAQYLAVGFQQGFLINCEIFPNAPIPKNHKSATEHPSVVDGKIADEPRKGRIAGPFIAPPFQTFQVSPLGVVAKKEQKTPAQKRDVQSLMQYFRGICTDKPERTTLTEHSITLRTDKPIGVRPYPIPFAKVSTIEREVDKMSRIGVIEPSKSPLLLVDKSDGTNRPVVDFRLLNKARYSMLNQCLIPSSYSPD